MANGKRIADDETYERSRLWLIKRSVELEDPLLDPAEKAKMMRSYDYVFEAVQRYRRGQMVREYPGLREQYKILGWAYDELDESGRPIDSNPSEAPEMPEASPQEPEPESKTETEPQPQPAAAALANWLDDD